MSFERTNLWKRTLAGPGAGDPHAADRERLRAAFSLFRERAGALANEIGQSYPTLTLHDVGHLDALWDAADMVAGPEYPLNPAEAFVLGGAFLVHDLGNGLAAYPRSLDELRHTTQWRDAVGSRIRRSLGRPPTASEMKQPSGELFQAVLEATLRALHAKHAEHLVSEVTFGPQRLRLLQDDDLREAYGRIIGIIAYSHWWNVEDLHVLRDESLGPPVWCGSREWTIDALKLACLMRAADAAQIDARRAPPFIQALRHPRHLSEQHWSFQRRIATKPTLSPGGDRLLFKTSSSFPRNESDAWWLCFDTMSMVDRELRGVDALLSESDSSARPRLAARGVVGVESPQHMAKHIRTSEWSPVDARVQVSDVPSLIERLGGKNLYGNFPWIPLRELIQNAGDAVRARRILDSSWNPTSGRITVRVGQEQGIDFCEVSDNGVGMTEQVLTRELLDFGQSFWGTERMSLEFPGLNSSPFQPTGQFGVGFFSAFMWGRRVRVITQRFDKGLDSQRVLELASGPSGRPLVRSTSPDERLSEPGTAVRVWFDDSRSLARLLRQPMEFGDLPMSSVWGRGTDFEPEDEEDGNTSDRVTIAELVPWVAPTIDVDLWAAAGTATPVRVLEANDWRRVSREQLLKRLYLHKASELQVPLLCPLEGDQGLLGFNLKVSVSAAATVGGMRSHNPGFNGLEIAGVYLTEAEKADRSGLPLRAGRYDLAKWATQLAVEAATQPLARHEKTAIARHVLKIGGSSGPLELATVHSPTGTARADEAALFALFERCAIVIFALLPDAVDELLRVANDIPVVAPDHESNLYHDRTSNWLAIVATNTSAAFVLARAWGLDQQQLERTTRITALETGSGPTGVKIMKLERRGQRDSDGRSPIGRPPHAFEP